MTLMAHVICAYVVLLVIGRSIQVGNTVASSLMAGAVLGLAWTIVGGLYWWLLRAETPELEGIER